MIVEWGKWFRLFWCPRSFMLSVWPIVRLWVSWGGVRYFDNAYWWGVEIDFLPRRRRARAFESRWRYRWYWQHKVITYEAWEAGQR